MRSKWPAIIFAVKRTVNVIGRIIFLIVSIQTINGINKIGVPWGTRCLNMWLVFLNHPYIKNLNHKGNAIDKFKVRCLVPVKMYGNKPIKLFIIMKINKEMKIRVKLLFFLLLIIIENSLNKTFIIFV